MTTTGGLSDELLALIARPIVEAAEKARIGIAVSSVDGPDIRRVYVSNVAAQILGYAPEELIGSPTLLSFTPEESARMAALSARWLNGEPVPHLIESVVIGKDGKRIPVEVGYSPAQIGGKPATVSFLRDISERKRTEEALEKSESLFRQLIEFAPEAVVVTRLADNVILYANPRHVELLGYDDIEEVKALSLLDIVHPDELWRLNERRQSMIEHGGTAPGSREYRLRRKDGSVICVDCSSLTIEFEGARAALSFLHDITARKEAQEQLIQTDRMAAIGTLAAAVAHELNNPLAYIVLNLGLFERELGDLVTVPDDRERIRERLRMIQEGTTQLATIVRDLRSFCRPNSVPTAVDVRSVLESALNIAMNEIRERARVIRDFSPTPCVLADAARLGQVFLNLLLNAAQALPDRDPTKNEIRVALRGDGTERVIVEITDTGRGIAPADLGRIFEPFFTTKPAGIGTGLGLSISKSIVTAMAGQLTVESEVGRGSTFRVVLPATDATSENENASSKEARTPEPPPVRSRVLVVDDEVAIAKTLQSVLATDHDVVAATSGEEARALLVEQNASFDAIVCDVLMPGMSGIDLYGEVERHRPELVMRMIFMSGASCMPAVVDFFERIRNPRLEKPLDLRRLRTLIRKLRA
jgi:PAS domain S-box-containing protein